MPLVRFLEEDARGAGPSGGEAKAAREVEATVGATILEAARLAGLAAESPCGGAGLCGKCKRRLPLEALGNVRSPENGVLTQEERAAGVVLACETEIVGDISVFYKADDGNEGLRILSEGAGADISLAPYVTKRYVESEGVTRVYGGDRLLLTEAGDTSGEAYGLSLDIGTTTLVMSLVDLATGRELGAASALNPQAAYAQDVLSRIKLASEPAGLAKLRSVFLEEANRMAGELSERHGVRRDRVYEAVYSGNTCMLHLAAGASPEPLGRYPYTPALNGGESYGAADQGLDISPGGLIYMPPIISAYVGADITSGILATELLDRAGVTLFVDIGTNGEMALNANGRVYAASTAAGPAFEGMNISCGMRAGAGAIERVEISDGEVRLGVIGGGAAKGLCGSGLIDAAGEMAARGIVEKSGRFAAPEATGFPDRFTKEGGKTAFALAEGVAVSQNDLRQIQLAKGAIRAGIESLLRQVGIPPEAVGRTLIAGSFGYHLRPESLFNIGLLPRALAGGVEFVGNTSGAGGKAFLLDWRRREEMKGRVKEIEALELANLPDFDRLFISCLNFQDEPAL
ncbi:MAG: ASKHA domain-containing protein [Clostridiales Family XIII bacterium]|jgi:uncharacterized 2Fe-2S/4Fe-4S cluster protein (DUF4445 family)|nr:ASKHA domain-containing protein [Clostridiales Family XIII bacterium]